MQKVEGSSPFSRFAKALLIAGFFRLMVGCMWGFDFSSGSCSDADRVSGLAVTSPASAEIKSRAPTREVDSPVKVRCSRLSRSS